MRVVESADRADDAAALVEAIAAALVGPDACYVEVVPGEQPAAGERIALVRSCGRRAARQLGVSVRTSATDEGGMLRFGGMTIVAPREDGAREVHVVRVG